MAKQLDSVQDATRVLKVQVAELAKQKRIVEEKLALALERLDWLSDRRMAAARFEGLQDDVETKMVALHEELQQFHSPDAVIGHLRDLEGNQAELLKSHIESEGLRLSLEAQVKELRKQLAEAEQKRQTELDRKEKEIETLGNQIFQMSEAAGGTASEKKYFHDVRRQITEVQEFVWCRVDYWLKVARLKIVHGGVEAAFEGRIPKDPPNDIAPDAKKGYVRLEDRKAEASLVKRGLQSFYVRCCEEYGSVDRAMRSADKDKSGKLDRVEFGRLGRSLGVESKAMVAVFNYVSATQQNGQRGGDIDCVSPEDIIAKAKLVCRGVSDGSGPIPKGEDLLTMPLVVSEKDWRGDRATIMGSLRFLDQLICAMNPTAAQLQLNELGVMLNALYRTCFADADNSRICQPVQILKFVGEVLRRKEEAAASALRREGQLRMELGRAFELLENMKVKERRLEHEMQDQANSVRSILARGKHRVARDNTGSLRSRPATPVERRAAGLQHQASHPARDGGSTGQQRVRSSSQPAGGASRKAVHAAPRAAKVEVGGCRLTDQEAEIFGFASPSSKKVVGE
mmetsp:Transcript_81038/g.216410  ORF Transcript_81038/g.216410 Transcript_81038/m.216410 type:complete len:570 (-) Transcript_81038:47-1756(-)